ncbi:uncharacterized protein LOC128553765 [Mercenaria mercenaria]|uniref:uncharacterized protein LOC128553765 n=1 Tax=Mercenaria mercenaria TaxID=6596 RepID=UPI00234FAA11|nr:uncharacterized protein LOC128553765 [Mercenaria mercenaria]
MGSLKSAWQPFKKEHDDTLSQTMVLALHEQMKSVGVLISGGNLGGTVFRVGSKYVMTALHVINNIIDPTKTGVWDVTLLESTDTHINFHESPLTPPMVPYRLKRDFMYNVDLDVALLEVTNPSNLPMKLNLCKDEIGVTNVSLIGYGHPGQIKKCLDPKCEIVHPNSHRILSAQAWLQQNKNFFKLALHGIGRNPALVDKGYQGYDQSSKLIFDCYMKRGASGAPALTNDNERSVQVVGILTHGLPDFYFSLPELMKPQFPKNYRLEVGAKMKDIFNWINSQSREIAKDLFGEGSQMPDRNQLQLPKEITDMDNETVETYIRALEKGKTEYNNIRVMVVGHFGVGKTTLVNRLFGQFKDEETTETPSTNGIETHVRQCNIISDDKNEKMIWKQKKDGK